MQRDYVITKDFLLGWFNKCTIEHLEPRTLNIFTKALDICDLDIIFDYLVFQMLMTGHIDNAFVLHLIKTGELVEYYKTPVECNDNLKDWFEVLRKATFEALTKTLKET